MRKFLFNFIPLIAFFVIFVFAFIPTTEAGNTISWGTTDRIEGYHYSSPLSKISVNGTVAIFNSDMPNLAGSGSDTYSDIFVFNRQTKSIALASVSQSEDQGNQNSSSPTISSDGKHIAFQSQASNMVTNGQHTCLYFGALYKQCSDIFVRDNELKTTQRVSVSSNGIAGNGNSTSASVSDDGRYIAFASEATNLVQNGANSCFNGVYTGQCKHIFLRDTQSGTTSRISLNPIGEAGNSHSYDPSISGDGKNIVFLSQSNNLVPKDNNGQMDVFVRRLDTNQTELLSIASDETQANLGVELTTPAISENGRYIAFVSKSNNLVSGDTNDSADVFVRDTLMATTKRINVASDGTQAYGHFSYEPFNISISSDGHIILFNSSATNLVPDDTNNTSDIFTHDLLTEVTTRVSIAQDGSQSNGSNSGGTISPDGKFAVFNSSSNNLIPGDNNDWPDIFITELKETPLFPYFSQKDPAWGSQEYDSANTHEPFFCGTTMTGCGCATTSSAMLLKYYGVDKSPEGNPTNPGVLNNWLKTNRGYAFGALKWNSIASYSVKANKNFGTQKIRFIGTGAGNLASLNQDLTNNKPPILEEPGHFIVATGKQESTFSINDPAWENRKTLNSYGNSYLSSRRYEKTNTDLSSIYISAPAPTSIFITDSSGQRAGKDPETGIIYTEISNSFYFLDPTLINGSEENHELPPEGSGVQVLTIINPISGPYTIQINNPNGDNKAEFSTYDRDGEISTQEFTQTTPPNSPVNFELNYSPESGSTIDIVKTVQVDYLPFNKKNILPLIKAHLPIALLSSPTFNPKDAIVESIIISREGKPIKNRAFYFKMNKDKVKDALFFFNPVQAKVSKDDSSICMKGKTKDGLTFKGCDTVKVLLPRHFWEHPDDMDEVQEYLE